MEVLRVSEYLRADKEKLMRDIECFRAKAIELGAEAAVPIRTRLIVVRDWAEV